jgi:hypothetical protein
MKKIDSPNEESTGAQGTISIVTLEPEEKGAHTILPSIGKNVVQKISSIDSKRVSKELGRIITMLSKMVESLPESSSGYNVSTLSFSLSINSSGKISLIGEVGAGVTSGITVTLTKNS